jgi:L-ascorbate metabolism protein UlaG (beta-lactamase superfamily)
VRAGGEHPTSLLSYYGHATVGIELAGAQVLTDPMLTKGVSFIRRVGTRPTVARDVPRLVLISHGHHDHLHMGSLRRAGSGIRLVVPIGLGSLVRRWGFRDVTELPVGATVSHGDLEVTAVRAVHSGLRVPFGPRAEAIGYVIAGGGRTIYFAGDTDLFDEMGDIGELGLDVALLPVWGWGPRLGPGHLDPGRAAVAVEILRPAVAVPIHWGTLWPMAMPWRRHVLTEPPLDFVAEVERRGVPSRAVILEPGQQLDLGASGESLRGR